MKIVLKVKLSDELQGLVFSGIHVHGFNRTDKNRAALLDKKVFESLRLLIFFPYHIILPNT